MNSDKLVGSIISLITNAGVRYGGSLVKVDGTERSMNLKDVQSYGTEGRRNGVNEIPAHENVIPSVVFKVDHIKDFQIVKRPEDLEEEKAEPKTIEEQDPAIVSAQPKEQKEKKEEPKQQTEGKGERDLQTWEDKSGNTKSKAST